MTLHSILQHQPVPLQFGTSGRRGKVSDLTQLEVYINVRAEIEYLQSLPPSHGGILSGHEFYFAADLRPSSTVVQPDGGGGIAQAVACAIEDCGMHPVYLGLIPTPALTCYALERGKGSIMVTGSHIPFDRNGYKTNSAIGELRKEDEAPISQQVEKVRASVYSTPFESSPFNERGQFKHARDLPPASDAARQSYLNRYVTFFGSTALAGQTLLVYQHSAVGRDLLVEILHALGAVTIPAGRTDTFVPIDTENVDAAQLRIIQDLTDEVWREHGPLTAVVSTDGDSDRPLLLGVSPDSGSVTFHGGDLVGMVTAAFLQADAVVVPISCNDGITLGDLRHVLEPMTRIGSPFVIAGMAQAVARSRTAVCGWEANGGFLTATSFTSRGHRLSALPTRDAVLPILSVLTAAAEKRLSVNSLFDQLPRRYSRAALLRNFPRTTSLRILEFLSCPTRRSNRITFDAPNLPSECAELQWRLSQIFTSARGFGHAVAVDYTDGVRVNFSNGDVAHVRPSGNADELRIYAVAGQQTRANTIAALGVEEPAGILRSLERLATQPPT